MSIDHAIFSALTLLALSCLACLGEDEQTCDEPSRTRAEQAVNGFDTKTLDVETTEGVPYLLEFTIEDLSDVPCEPASQPPTVEASLRLYEVDPGTMARGAEVQAYPDLIGAVFVVNEVTPRFYFAGQLPDFTEIILEFTSTGETFDVLQLSYESREFDLAPIE